MFLIDFVAVLRTSLWAQGGALVVRAASHLLHPFACHLAAVDYFTYIQSRDLAVIPFYRFA